MSQSKRVLQARSCASAVRRRIVLLLAGAVLVTGCRSTRVVPPPQLTQIPPRTAYERPIVPPRVTPEAPTADNPWEPPVTARNWRSIVLHHSAGDEGDVATIDAVHRKRVDGSGNPWLGIGYHFVIGNGNGMGDGQIEATFRWQEQLHGAHAGNYEYNQFGIGIVLVGNFEHDIPSPAQQAAATRLVQTLRRAYDIPSDQVVAHRDIRATACPGKHFPLTEIAQGSGDRYDTARSAGIAVRQGSGRFPFSLTSSQPQPPISSYSNSSLRSLSR